MEATPEDWERLWGAIEARAAKLKMNWTEVAGAVSLSDMSLYKIRDGVGLSQRKKIDGIDKGMQWEEGSTRAILAGGEPVPLDPPDYLTREEAEQQYARRDVVEGLLEIVESTPGTVDALVRQLEEMRRVQDELREALNEHLHP